MPDETTNSVSSERIAAQLAMCRTMAHTVGWRFDDRGTSIVVYPRAGGDPAAAILQMRSQIATVIDTTVLDVVEIAVATGDGTGAGDDAAASAGAQVALELRPCAN